MAKCEWCGKEVAFLKAQVSGVSHEMLNNCCGHTSGVRWGTKEINAELCRLTEENERIQGEYAEYRKIGIEELRLANEEIEQLNAEKEKAESELERLNKVLKKIANSGDELTPEGLQAIADEARNNKEA